MLRSHLLFCLPWNPPSKNPLFVLRIKLPFGTFHSVLLRSTCLVPLFSLRVSHIVKPRNSQLIAAPCPRDHHLFFSDACSKQAACVEVDTWHCRSLPESSMYRASSKPVHLFRSHLGGNVPDTPTSASNLETALPPQQAEHEKTE